MEFKSLQVERAKFIQFHYSIVSQVWRYLTLIAGAGALVLILFSLFSPINGMALIVSYFLIALGLLSVSVDLYIRFLTDHQLFLINLNKVTNSLDLASFDLVKVLLQWRKNPQVRTLFVELYENPEVMLLFSRLGVGREFNHKVLSNYYRRLVLMSRILPS